MNALIELPEMLFEIADRLKLKAPTEAGLAELPPSELEVLRLVTLFPGCGITFLTDRTKMRQANTSSTVRSLVQRGLVRKMPGETDKRAVRLYATAQASRDLEALRKVWLGRLLAAFAAAGLTEPEQARLLADLEALLAAMSPARSNRLPGEVSQAASVPAAGGSLRSPAQTRRLS